MKDSAVLFSREMTAFIRSNNEAGRAMRMWEIGHVTFSEALQWIVKLWNENINKQGKEDAGNE